MGQASSLFILAPCERDDERTFDLTDTIADKFFGNNGYMNNDEEASAVGKGKRRVHCCPETRGWVHTIHLLRNAILEYCVKTNGKLFRVPRSQPGSPAVGRECARRSIVRFAVITFLVAAFPQVSTGSDQSGQGLQGLPFLEEFSPVEGVYYYDVFLNSLRVGKATVRTERINDLYQIEVKAKTRSSFSSLYKVKYRGEVEMQQDPIQPIQVTIEEETGRKRKDIGATFTQDNQLAVKEVKSEDGKKRSEREYFLDSDTFILDPFSTLFLVRALDWHVGMAEIFDVFSGSKKYELFLECTEETEMEFDGRSREVWMIQPLAINPEKPKEKRLAGYTIVLSRDSQREILLISGMPKFGSVEMALRKFDAFPSK